MAFPLPGADTDLPAFTIHLRLHLLSALTIISFLISFWLAFDMRFIRFMGQRSRQITDGFLEDDFSSV